MSRTAALNWSEFRLWLASEQELQITMQTEMPSSSRIWTSLASVWMKEWCCNVLRLFSPPVILIFLVFCRLTESSKSKICQYFLLAGFFHSHQLDTQKSREGKKLRSHNSSSCKLSFFPFVCCGEDTECYKNWWIIKKVKISVIFYDRFICEAG